VCHLPLPSTLLEQVVILEGKTKEDMPGGYGGMMLFASIMDVSQGLKLHSYGPVKRKTTIE
jgi:hypothetical protein